MTLSRLLLLLTALGCLSATAAAQDGDGAPTNVMALEVMTFNIRTSSGRDGDDAWSFRKELVAETIGRSNPQLLGLQEALADQIEYLEGALPQYRWLGVDRGLNGGRGLSEATPIFYRYEELIPIEFGTFWLGDPPDARSPPEGRSRRDSSSPPEGRSRRDGRSRRGRGSRIVTWARFHHLETSQQIYVYNTHFTIREGQRQLDSANLINEHIATHPTGSAIIVMGDFNAAAESSETWKVATSQGLRDAWGAAVERTGPAVTSNGFGPPPQGWEQRIDWILVGGPVDVPSASTVVHSVGGRYPSDHYPVQAKLIVRPG